MHTYLALGDSYTIGEQVPLHESFPYQLVQMLREEGIKIHAPEIVAKTGWTSNELIDQIIHTKLLEHYDLVTLLIGVNNQYRKRPVEDFIPELELLLTKAVRFAGGNPSHVIMLSIPDWGVTPFAKDKDAKEIAKEIDEYNKACATAAEKAGVHFIDITTSQRKNGAQVDFLAGDGLHPSGREYKKWAEAVKKKALEIKTLQRH
ncbi:MAG: SGNH/GDSL hydrolase family protein [Chitinophagaceae bacterium]|nr:MAG: SGNH/GDSL hydrolase family protein [Chitinophagaceae bacterium]